MPKKLFSKKRRKIYKSNSKISLEETNLRKAIISSLNCPNKTKLLVFILPIIKSKPKAKDIDIAIIFVYSYYVIYSLKDAWVLVVSMRDIQY